LEMKDKCGKNGGNVPGRKSGKPKFVVEIMKIRDKVGQEIKIKILTLIMWVETIEGTTERRVLQGEGSHRGSIIN